MKDVSLELWWSESNPPEDAMFKAWTWKSTNGISCVLKKLNYSALKGRRPQIIAYRAIPELHTFPGEQGSHHGPSAALKSYAHSEKAQRAHIHRESFITRVLEDLRSDVPNKS